MKVRDKLEYLSTAGISQSGIIIFVGKSLSLSLSKQLNDINQ